jgi:hypothetical protein
MKRYRMVLALMFIALAAVAISSTVSAQAGMRNFPSDNSWTMDPSERLGVGSANMFYAENYLLTPDFILWLETQLKLSDEQKEQLVKMRLKQINSHGDFSRRLAVTNRELTDLLNKKNVDMSMVEQKVREIEKLRADYYILRVVSNIEAQKILNNDQTTIIEELSKKYIGKTYPYAPFMENYNSDVLR